MVQKEQAEGVSKSVMTEVETFRYSVMKKNELNIMKM